MGQWLGQNGWVVYATVERRIIVDGGDSEAVVGFGWMAHFGSDEDPIRDFIA